ncbi:T9SS type B sorting domain-containing protein [Sanyastnella coralliicola]|uniref:T9SS type B sorting domain-containing protein n=1 Tax=Sanyastnella coralliicola TaxID=3069118 RepID=UPI0027BA7CA4|nr:T9SS type B sorting domain-containing protein [Longitalea sp. SCSIO 12813]
MRFVFCIVLASIFLPAQAQEILDPCFYSVPTGAEFANSENIANEVDAAGGADMVKYEDGAWSGGGSGSNLNLEPPVNCDAVKAVFLRPSGGAGEGVGFRLNQPLTAGTAYGFEFAFASHGTGSNGAFELRVFTADGPDLWVDGFQEGTQVATIGPFGNDWEDFEYNGVANVAQNGHQWVFLYTEESSGLILNGCQNDIEELTLDLPQTTELCEGESVVIGDPSLAAGNPTWNTGATTATITVNESGFYVVSAENACNSVQDGTNVIVYGDPVMVPEQDTTICLGDELEFRTEGLSTQNLWSDGSTDSLFFATEPGMYGVTVTDDCGTASYMIEVTLDSLPVFDLGPDTALCFDQQLNLSALIDDPDATYLWNTEAESSNIDVIPNESAIYTADVTNQCGTSSDAIFVEYSLLPTDILAGGYELCFGIPFVLDVSAVEGTYEWRDGSTAPTFQVPSPGTYWVTITDDDDCWETTVYTEVTVIPCTCPMFLPNSFTPNGDGRNDVWAPVFECEPYDYELRIFDRWGGEVFSILDPSIGWNGKVGGEFLRDGVYVYELTYREEFAGIPITKFGHVVVLQEDRE